MVTVGGVHEEKQERRSRGKLAGEEKMWGRQRGVTVMEQKARG